MPIFPFPLPIHLPQTVNVFPVSRIINQIAHLMRVFLQIIELFTRTGPNKPAFLILIERAFFMELKHTAHHRHVQTKSYRLIAGLIGSIITDITITAIAHAPLLVIALIHTVTCGKNIAPRWRSIFPSKCLAIHIGRRLDTRQ